MRAALFSPIPKGNEQTAAITDPLDDISHDIILGLGYGRYTHGSGVCFVFIIQSIPQRLRPLVWRFYSGVLFLDASHE
jgi:hypothetical protein